MMRRNKLTYLFLVLVGIVFSTPGWTGEERHPQTRVGHLTAVDQKTRSVVIDGRRYRLRLGAKIFIAGKEVFRSSLYPDRKVRYTTHKNQRSDEIEIKAITVLLL